MRKEEKTAIIENLAEQLQQTPHFYIADTSGLNAENTTKLRRECFEKKIKLVVVKNTLLQKALEKNNFAESGLYPTLIGPTSVMLTDVANAPARLIKEFGAKYGKPELKSAYVQECLYLGANTLETLVNVKSRDELIGDIIGLLQSPAKNIISALQGSAGQKVAGIVKALEERNA
jgi:large subunit ribosomal protein L10